MRNKTEQYSVWIWSVRLNFSPTSKCHETNFQLFLVCTKSAGLSGGEWHFCLPESPAATPATSSAITPLVSFCSGEGIVVVESPSLSLTQSIPVFHVSPWEKPQGSCLFKIQKHTPVLVLTAPPSWVSGGGRYGQREAAIRHHAQLFFLFSGSWWEVQGL